MRFEFGVNFFRFVFRFLFGVYIETRRHRAASEKKTCSGRTHTIQTKIKNKKTSVFHTLETPGNGKPHAYHRYT